MKNILITGANRGLGLEFVKQLSQKKETRIFACCREPEKANTLNEWAQRYNNISIHQLDVTQDQHIQTLVKTLNNIPLDWIILNAGISGESGVTLGNVDRENFLNVLNVNSISPVIISDALLKNLSQGHDKLIVCISSQMGSIADNRLGRSYAYRSSKAALNCVMRSFALDAQELGIHVMLLHPGWVKTNMGGDDAPVDAQTSVSNMLQVIEAKKGKAHAEALFNYEGKKIDW